MNMYSKFDGLVNGNKFKVFGFVYFENCDMYISNDLNFSKKNCVSVRENNQSLRKVSINNFENYIDFKLFLEKEYYIVFEAYRQLVELNKNYKEKIENNKRLFEENSLVIEDMLNMDESKIEKYKYKKVIKGEVSYLTYDERLELLFGKCEGYLEFVEKYLNKVKMNEITLEEMKNINNDNFYKLIFNKIKKGDKGKFDFIFFGRFLKKYNEELDCFVENFVIDTSSVLNSVKEVIFFDNDGFECEKIRYSKKNSKNIEDKYYKVA